MKWYGEGMNPYEQEVMDTMGGGIDQLNQDIGDYMNPYQQAVTDRGLANIQQRTDQQRSGLMGNNARAGVGAFGSSALGTQLSQLENNSQNRMADFEALQNQQNYNQALGLRNQTLSQMLGAGQMPYGRVMQLGEGLGQFPGSSTQTQKAGGGGLLGPLMGAAKMFLG